MPDFHLYLFGAPRVERDGVPLAIERRKAIALLAYLAMHRHIYSRDVLAALFWPEADQPAARTNLRHTLVVLHQDLGADLLAVDRNTVALPARHDLRVDVEEFRALIVRCRALATTTDGVGGMPLDLLYAAVTLYTDDFLAGFSLEACPDFEEWQRLEAASLRRELAYVLEHLAMGFAARQEYELAFVHAHRWLDIDPLHEPAYRALMNLHAANGDRAGALQVYGECAAILQRELDVVPDPATRAVRERLLGM
jgi:DNA-binding SARP family transcriptional activator